MSERIESESSVFYSRRQRYDEGLWADVFVLARGVVSILVGKIVDRVRYICRNVNCGSQPWRMLWMRDMVMIED